MNFLKIFCDSFIDNWDEPAITSYSTGLTLTYASLGARIERVNRLLEVLKIPVGTHVAIVGNNSIDWITNYMAAMFYGAVTVTVQVTYDADEMLSLLASADVEILFIDPELMPENPDFAFMPSLKLVVSQDTQRVLYYRPEVFDRAQVLIDGLDQLFVNLYPGGFIPGDISVHETKPDSPAAIFFTAGTVGAPKPVLLSSDSMEGNLIFGMKNSLFPRGSNTLTTSSVGNVWGTIFNVLVPLASGAHITVFNDFYNSESLLVALRRVKPRRVIMSPRQLREAYTLIESNFKRSSIYRFLNILPFNRMLLYAAMRYAFNKALGGNCREVVVGSTNIERTLKKKLHRVGIHFTVSYGLVENGGLVCYTPAEDFIPTTVGHSISSIVKCRVRPLELEGFPDDVGILETHGMTVMKEYYNDRESTVQAFTSDGWLSTRDLAVIDSKGLVTIVGRLDTIIVRPGGIIVPERLEATIVDMPEVKQAVIVDREGVLTAIVHPDYEHVGGDAHAAIADVIERVNSLTPGFIYIDEFEVSEKPLDITLKGTVARYKYF